MIPDKLFINLKILSKIQKNGRISRSSDGIIALEHETFYQSVKRFITSDSRRQSVFEINSIINETITCMNNIVNSKFMNKIYSNTDEYYKNCETLSLLLKELTESKIGIENLKFTYSSDPNVNSQLEILIIKINGTIKDMQYKLSYFQSYLPESYKQDTNSQPVNPNYYINETTSIQTPPPTASNISLQPPYSYSEQFIDTQEMNNESNTIIDMNSVESVV